MIPDVAYVTCVGQRQNYLSSCVWRGPCISREPETRNAPKIDCEKSLFFFRFSKGSARARERLAAKPRDARNEDGSLSLLAPSVTRVVICVSRAFCSTDQEKRETARSLHPKDLFIALTDKRKGAH